METHNQDELERANYCDENVAPGSREKLLDAVAKSAYNNDRAYEGCCRGVLAALQEHLHMVDEPAFRAVLKSSTALSAGIARKGEVCGALVGAIMAVGLATGSETIQDMDGYRRGMQSAAKLYETFRAHYGTVRCFELQRKVLGRSYDFWKEADGIAWYHDGGLHECPSVCAEAARMAAELILDLE